MPKSLADDLLKLVPVGCYRFNLCCILQISFFGVQMKQTDYTLSAPQVFALRWYVILTHTSYRCALDRTDASRRSC